MLAAISGGSDSLALLHLLAASPYRPFVQVVHIDHGWREGSGREGEEVARLAEQLALPCHQVAVALSPTELGAREQRLEVYKHLLDKTGAQAVLLAHHRDDLSETVFKRLVEGASLAKLATMGPEAIVEGVLLWRPLLPFSRKELAHFPPIASDPTNTSTRYHRGRLRSELFPFLEGSLGRPIAPNLARLSGEAALLTDYLDEEAAPYLETLREGPLGCCLELASPPHPFLLAHLVRRFAERVGKVLSREEVEGAVALLRSGAANRTIGGLSLDRGRLLFLRPPLQVPPQPLALGTHRHGPWEVTVEPASGARCSGWEGFWKGRVETVVPEGEYTLVSYPGGRRLSRLLTAHKVPAPLRMALPTLVERATGEPIWWWAVNRSGWKISLELTQGV